MEVVIAGRTVHLPDHVSTEAGTVCPLSGIERGLCEQWVRLVYRARGTEAVDDPGEDEERLSWGPNWIPAWAVDQIAADALAVDALEQVAEHKRRTANDLERLLGEAGDVLASVYGGGVLWGP